MIVRKHFHFTGSEQRWEVPEGVTSARFECWGAAGGLPSELSFAGKVRQVVGGTGPRNIYFYNSPVSYDRLGTTYPNNAGYAAGTQAVNPGEVYYVYVGGNGQPGHSTIKLNHDGTYSIGLRGGPGGWNGGGDGGKGAYITQNLYNALNDVVQYVGPTMPPAARVGQLWHDTGANQVKRCVTGYSGGGSAADWTKVTHSHTPAVGPSGGGGGGATDIRLNSDDLTDRILVAGGGGGAGGHWNKTGTGAWHKRAVPTTPHPPFGKDAKRGTGPEHTWCTPIDFLTPGWGGGGLGGATGPSPNAVATTDGGKGTQGGGGGPATARHHDGTAPTQVPGSGGTGGGVTSGSLGVGLAGQNADGGHDDWCAGGGGGGGGYYGGGGGDQGFKVSGANSGIGTRGGGGGGGSNYAGPTLTQTVLVGGARPPSADKTKGVGANGLGGFCRITYNQNPVVEWTDVPRAVLGGSNFDATFDYIAPVEISHWEVGTGADTDDAPTANRVTKMVKKASTTSFTHTFTAPAVGNTMAIFARATDLDGDTSEWIKFQITGITANDTDPATITSPAAGTEFVKTANVTWSLGTQTPLAAYRLGVMGTDLEDGEERRAQTGWRRGGSRVNFAYDPGFEAPANVWEALGGAGPMTSQTNFPGISGFNGQIAWHPIVDFSAGFQTVTWDTLLPGVKHRLHLEIASASANDPRPVEVQVWDAEGLLTHHTFDLSALAGGSYASADIQFTPHTQGVYFVLLPSSVGVTGDPLFAVDFEDDALDGVTVLAGATGTPDTTQSNSGLYSLHLTGPLNGVAAQLSVPIADLPGPGNYVAEAMVYSPNRQPYFAVGGTGVAVSRGGSDSAAGDLNKWVRLRVPFTWDGAGTIMLDMATDSTVNNGGVWYDDLKVYAAGAVEYGNADVAAVNYLRNMLIELVYEEDGTLGYQPYFDGSHLNGLSGAVSWSGASNDSPSFLTGANVTTGSVDYDGERLLNGSLYIDTLTLDTLLSGYAGTQGSIPMLINPDLPAVPAVTLEVNSAEGIMTLTIDAADEAATYKTVSIDIFRDGTRIATGLTPDDDTRQATYIDTPATGVLTSYLVRVFDSEGGYVDQTDGTVTVVA